MAADRDWQHYVAVEHRGRAFRVLVDINGTLKDAANSIAFATSTAPSTLKLLQGGRACTPSKAPQRPLAESGLLQGKWLLLASSEAEVNEVCSSRDLPGMASFEHEDMRHAARRRTQRDAAPHLPSGPYTFGRYEAWEGAVAEGAFPAPSQALALLHRLAADPGIAHVMRQHRWSVGLLAEMPPEGFVGISPVCILGYNTNQGQSIHLRLRTDDLKGFRRYQPIRDTLIHELTHNVWGDHDNRFKQLNSQLQREVKRVDSTYGGGHTLLGPAFQTEDDGLGDAAPAPSAHILGGSAVQAPATTAAAAAALRRFGGSTRPTWPPPVTHQAAGGEGSVPTEPAPAPATLLVTPLTSIKGLGHRHRSTEAAEAAMVSLGGSSADVQPGANTVIPINGGSDSDARTAMMSTPLTSSTPGHSASVEQTACEDSTCAAEAATVVSHARPEAWVPAPAPAGGSPDDYLVSMAERPADSSGAAGRAEEMDWSGIRTLPASEDTTFPVGSPSAPAASSAPPKPAATPAHVMPPHVGTASAASPTVTEAGMIPAAGPQEVRDPSGGDEVQRRLQRVQAALAALTATAEPAHTEVALRSLQKILQNVLSAPADPRVRRIRAQNAAFHTRVGRLPPAVDVLHLAGFEDITEVEGPVLALRRDDLGLIWLALSAVREQLVH